MPRRLTKEEFIAKARAVHGNKYNYDKVDYVNNHTAVTIICNKCGMVFTQMPNNHVNLKQGCPNCAKKLRSEAVAKALTITKEEFIKRSKEKHGDKYDYSMVEIKGNNTTKVTIKCNTCGTIFEQRISSHLDGHGCSKCAGNKKITKEEFIAKARERHKGKYDYNNIEWNGYTEKVSVTCPVHGNFPQMPKKHLLGQGCPDCAKERNKIKNKLTTEKFIENARKIHGSKYNYDKTIYSSKDKKVIITCPIHGDFEKLPSNHTSLKQGCPECAREAQMKTTEQFIMEARNIHGDKYIYNKVIYQGNDKKVIITCPEHGDFEQLAGKHTNGKQGCPWCKKSKLEMKTKRVLEESNIKYDSEKTFPWLKSNKNYSMPLDFYLPYYNIAIECQGIQHYKPHGIFTEKKVIYTQQNDKLKFSLCKEHGIPIYYIKYDDNVEEKLNEIISKIKTKQ